MNSKPKQNLLTWDDYSKSVKQVKTLAESRNCKQAKRIATVADIPVSDPKRFRIKAGHYYVRAEHPGISGFQDWTRKVESVIAAPKARNNRLSIVREYLANGLRHFRLGNGRLPEFQPIVREVEALRWLDENPFCEIVEVASPTSTPTI